MERNYLEYKYYVDWGFDFLFLWLELLGLKWGVLVDLINLNY